MDRTTSLEATERTSTLSPTGSTRLGFAGISVGCLLVTLALVMAACAPAVTVDRTVQFDGTVVPVEPGATVRVVVPFGYGDFRLEPGALDALPFPEIVFQPRDNVTGSFVLRAADAPEGWGVSLDRVERVVTRVDADEASDGDPDAPIAGRTYSLDVFLRVAVPADADPGTYLVVATLRAGNTSESQVRLTFTIPR